MLFVAWKTFSPDFTQLTSTPPLRYDLIRALVHAGRLAHGPIQQAECASLLVHCEPIKGGLWSLSRDHWCPCCASQVAGVPVLNICTDTRVDE